MHCDMPSQQRPPQMVAPAAQQVWPLTQSRPGRHTRLPQRVEPAG